MTVAVCSFTVSAENISFADEAVKTLCIANWDNDKDGELSMEEAAAVESLESIFRENKTILTFNELQYFTGLTEINDYAFYKSSLTSVVFPSTVSVIGNYSFSQSGISGELRVPGTIKEIGDYSFNSCQKMTSVILEEGVEKVGWHTFSGPISTFILPSTLTYMNSMAVDPYVNSNSSSGVFLPEGDLWVFSYAKTPPVIDSFAYFYIFGDGHLIVPYGSIDAYKAEDGWSHFKEYFEMGDVNADGNVTLEDMDLLQQVLNGEEVELKNELLADVNGDGVIDESDMDEIKTHFFAEDGTPTMIAEVEQQTGNAPDGVFTLDGRKVLDDVSQIQSLRPGIYISGGRKFIVR